jgi:GNAT superfamily N-acetyltransferase
MRFPALFRARRANAAPSRSFAVRPWTPIRHLGSQHRERVIAHLLRLSAEDRHLRFGHAATDEQIRRYVEQINFQRDEVFGIFDRSLELIAVAHTAFSDAPQSRDCAEFGVSVSSQARGRRYGARLFARAVMLARSRGVGTMLIHALTENRPMLKIARNAGAQVRQQGAESEAYLQLPPATLNTRVSKIVAERLGAADYQIKRQLQRWLAVRHG